MRKRGDVAHHVILAISHLQQVDIKYDGNLHRNMLVGEHVPTTLCLSLETESKGGGPVVFVRFMIHLQIPQTNLFTATLGDISPEPRNLANWILANKLKVQISLLPNCSN